MFRLIFLLPILCLFSCQDSPEQLVRRGEDQLKSGLNANAEIEFRKALQANPNLPEAQAGLSRAIARQFREAESIPEFRKAVRMAPSDPRLLAEYAELLLTGLSLIDNPDSVYIQELSQLIPKLQGLNGPAYDRLRLTGSYALLTKDWPVAIKSFQEAAAIAPPLINTARLGLARALYLSGQKENGLAEIEKAISQNPRAPETYDLLYVFSLKEKNATQGEAALHRKYAATMSPRVFVELARHYERNGARDNAIAALKRMSPADLESYGILAGEFLIAIREARLAIPYLQAVKKQNLKPLAYRRLVEANVLAGSVEEAKKLANEAAKEFPNDPQIASQRAALLARLGNETERKEGLAEFERLRKENPDQAEATYNLGVALAAQGKSSEAANMFRSASRQSPRYVAPRLALGELELVSNQGAAAARLAEECLRLEPENWNAKLLLASAQALLGSQDQASNLFQQMLRIRPDDPELRIRVAYQQLASRKYADAERAFRSLYKPGNADIRAIVGLANSLTARGQNSVALQVLEEETAKQKNPAPLKFVLANYSLSEGRVEQAAKISAELLQATQASPDSLLLQSEILQAQGRLPDALLEAKKALEKSPNNAVALKRVAFLNHISGNLVDAEKNYRLAIQQDKQAWDATNNLASLLTDSGKNLEEAERLGRSLVEAQPQNPAFQDTLAWALVKRNRPQEAIPILRSLTQKFPDSAVLTYHHGVALIEAGQVPQGKAQLTAALKKKGDPETLKQIETRLKSL